MRIQQVEWRAFKLKPTHSCISRALLQLPASQTQVNFELDEVYLSFLDRSCPVSLSLSPSTSLSFSVEGSGGRALHSMNVIA